MAIMAADTYGFTYSEQRTPALQDVTFAAAPGEVILIAGDSGSGKSTLLKSLNGLIPEIVKGRLTGQRFLNDQDMTNLSIDAVSRMVGTVFQNPRSQFFTLDATSEMVFAMENYGFSRQTMRARLTSLQKTLPITGLMNREIYGLSSGERQLLALATAMVLNPDVLLFDEPSANLDYHNAMALGPLIRKLKAMGKTVLVADHRYFYLGGVIDRVFALADRRLTVFESEAAFRRSSWNTRGFDLFALDTPCRGGAPRGDPVAEVCELRKWSVLRGVSLRFYTGEIAAVVGVNGVGKSTLAKLLTGSLRPDGGTVRTDDLPFYVMQDADYQLFGTSVAGELEIGRSRLSAAQKKAALQPLDLWPYRSTHPFNLSGGEKQRLQIAAASLSEATLIIFDEPTSGLDAQAMSRVAAAISDLADRKAVLVISHDYAFIRMVADRVIHLKDGRVARDFPLTPAAFGDLNQIFKEMETCNET